MNWSIHCCALTVPLIRPRWDGSSTAKPRVWCQDVSQHQKIKTFSVPNRRPVNVWRTDKLGNGQRRLGKFHPKQRTPCIPLSKINLRTRLPSLWGTCLSVRASSLSFAGYNWRTPGTETDTARDERGLGLYRRFCYWLGDADFTPSQWLARARSLAARACWVKQTRGSFLLCCVAGLCVGASETDGARERIEVVCFRLSSWKMNVFRL